MGQENDRQVLLGQVLITLPIFAVDGGDVTALDSVRAVELYVEPEDLALPVFDAEGRRLRLVAQDDSQRVKVVGVEEQPTHASELREALVQYLRAVGMAEEWLKLAPLAQLVRQAAQHASE